MCVSKCGGRVAITARTGEAPELDRLEAAAKIVSNHEGVVRFAARWGGERRKL